LQGTLDEEIYMKVLDGISKPGKDGWVWKLLKPLYGLEQPGRQWKKKLDAIMGDFDFLKSTADNCLYIKKIDRKIAVVVLVYVDDMAAAGPKIKDITSFKQNLGNKVKISDAGELKWILWIEVTHNQKA
jgi:hypothetical protein